MRFWLARNSEVPIREQLVTQITLGILSGDLEAGRKLPSTRELARRFRVHANTVSAAYKQLEEERWLESRHGSGVFVADGNTRLAKPRAKTGQANGDALAMDKLIADLFRCARDAGMPLPDLRLRLRHWMAMQPPDHFLLIEPDEELREIVMAEMRAGLKFAVRGCVIEDCAKPDNLAGAIPVVLPSKAEKVRKTLTASSECMVLQVRSVTSSLAGAPGASPELLVGVASRWPGFLKSARTMLVAAGFDTDSLMLRDARKAGWEKPLLQTSGVVCDAVTAQRLPKACRAFPFSLISEASLNELRRYEEFVSHPLN